MRSSDSKISNHCSYFTAKKCRDDANPRHPGIFLRGLREALPPGAGIQFYFG